MGSHSLAHVQSAVNDKNPPSPPPIEYTDDDLFLPISPRPARRTQFQIGYDTFWAGGSVTTLTTEIERAGFYAAADEQAEEYRRELEDAAWVRQDMRN